LRLGSDVGGRNSHVFGVCPIAVNAGPGIHLVPRREILDPGPYFLDDTGYVGSQDQGKRIVEVR